MEIVKEFTRRFAAGGHVTDHYLVPPRAGAGMYEHPFYLSAVVRPTFPRRDGGAYDSVGVGIDREGVRHGYGRRDRHRNANRGL